MNEQELIKEVIDETISPQPTDIAQKAGSEILPEDTPIKPTHRLDVETPITPKKKIGFWRIIQNVLRGIALTGGFLFAVLLGTIIYIYYHPEIIQGVIVGA